MTLYWFQVYSTMIPNLYILQRVHQNKSGLTSGTRHRYKTVCVSLHGHVGLDSYSVNL